MKMEKLSDQKKKNENSVIENWTKKTSVGWLRKQRDGVIGHLEERIKKLKNTTEKKIEELLDITKELTKLNDEIYEIEHSTITHESDSDSDSESDNESDNKSKSILSQKGLIRLTNEELKTLSKLKPGDKFKGITYRGPYNPKSHPKWIND